MMKLRVFSLLIFALLGTMTLHAQSTLSGTVIDDEVKKPIADAEVFIKELNQLLHTNNKGEFSIDDLTNGSYTISVFVIGYNAYQNVIDVNSDRKIQIQLVPYSHELSEVVISQKREEAFSLNRLNPVEGTAIYAGKKSEVILLDQSVGNMAANNARQIYSQVVGLNIYENNDAGLQLNVGGRGLDPNRTSNFNTRQNGYDISADVLGYPESYYTPPAEALSEIQVVRGAASLQYGTQFGGLINFKLKRPNPVKKIELVSRQSVGSFNLFTSFNSLSGTIGKFSYYTYFNYKKGDGFRPNSEFESKNFFAGLNYELGKNTKISLETTYLEYLAKQPGGLTDTQFDSDLNYSNRSRNWFQVNWKLAALKLEHKFSTHSTFSLNLFALDAQRNALGFRGDPLRPSRNPITEIDDRTAFTRDLIKGKFKNWGAEARYLKRYKILQNDAVFLIGFKYYRAFNSSKQGAGTNAEDANFNFANQDFPSYPHRSDFEFPNLNWSLFGEHIFFLTDKLSITPGIRFENIRTESRGSYTELGFDNAGNEISRKDSTDNRVFNRSFVLLGLGASYNHSDDLEFYANASQNYRSVTFNDIRVVNTTFLVDPNISDEKGYSIDVGMRGKWKSHVSYDIGGFAMNYNDRIGAVLVSDGPNKGDRVRKNVGDALIFGGEFFVDWNMVKSLGIDASKFKLSPFVNLSITRSEYIKSQDNNVKGKKVEFIPNTNLKSGLKFGYKNLIGELQYTYITSQFTDAENSAATDTGESREGIIGNIPAYDIVDLSLSYKFRAFGLETGINNLLNEKYFTRRATGYPGPGIIPSSTRSFYVTLQIKI